jgi:hypothetical protein
VLHTVSPPPTAQDHAQVAAQLGTQNTASG